MVGSNKENEMDFKESMVWTMAIFGTCGVALPFFLCRLGYVYYKMFKVK